MTDRGLLELAAKAASIELRWHADGTAHRNLRGTGYWAVWNPLTDDGDALRLAVTINKSDLYCSDKDWEECNHDGYAATRRAIVRAAAEIGKGMK